MLSDRLRWRRFFSDLDCPTRTLMSPLYTSLAHPTLFEALRGADFGCADTLFGRVDLWRCLRFRLGRG